MIIIDQPKVLSNDGKSRLNARIEIDNSQFENDSEQHELWFEVENEYEKYLCFERSDAFIVGALQWAMRNGHDITCTAPVTKELLYNLHEHLIPILFKYSRTFHKTRIFAPIADESIAKTDIDGVGTGMSCGVDSFHAVLNHYQNQNEYPNITHVCINNTGSFQGAAVRDTKGGPRQAKNEVYDNARAVAAKLGLPLIESDSNIYDIFPIFEHAHTFTTTFATLCMQKLWKTYFFASSKDYSNFTLIGHEAHDCSFYDLLSLNCFSTQGLRIYSEGSSIDRLQKLEFIADNPVVQKHLHCCYVKTTNCATCYKCRRTMMMLDILGKLDDFADIFPIDYYRANMKDYVAWLIKSYEDKNAHALAIYPHVRKGKYIGEYIEKHWAFDDLKENAPKIQAGSVCVMDIKTGEIIYSKNANMIGATAAAKILNCIIAIKLGDPDKAYNLGGSSETITLRDMLYGMMLESRNDFAAAIANCISGSAEVFVSEMNTLAKRLHMNNSLFQSPTGMKDFTTARDTALLTCYAMQFPLFCEIIAAKEYVFKNERNAITFKNTNMLITQYPHCIGGKTAALGGKFSLVSIAEKDDKRHVLVQMNADSFMHCFGDGVKMHDWVFELE